MKKMKSLLITGADGFIGSHLTDYFLDKYEIIALKKSNTDIKNLNHLIKEKNKEEIFDGVLNISTAHESLRILEGDLRNTEQIYYVISHYKPDFILHFGAQSLVIKSWNDPANTIRTNVIGTINIFETLKKENLKSRVVVACSSAEYGLSTELKRPLKEEDPLLAVHPYGISKIATELLSRQYYLNFGIESINLRLFNQTGIRKTDDACSDFSRAVAKIQLDLTPPVIKVGNLDTYRDITGIEDTVKAIDLAMLKGSPGETYNVCSGKKNHIRKILNTILGFSDKKIKVLEETPDRMRFLDEDVILGDNSKIQKELGWEIKVPIEKVLKNMFDFWVEYYKNI